MSWIIPWLLLAVAPIDEEAALFLKDLYIKAPQGASSKCHQCTSLLPGHSLKVFMSFSVPLESWKEWSQTLEKTGGSFILRGLPANSFQEFTKKVRTLRHAGVQAPIDIDPESFAQYGVQSVPTTIVLDGQKIYKMAGNVRLEWVLAKFSENGSDTAAQMLKNVSNVGRSGL